MSKFQPNITNIHFEKGEFRFNLSGTETYGLDKSFMNAIRRVLLTDIPTVAFRVDENKEKDITINTNSGSIHNEILIQRIGLLPLYINPDNYTKNYLFKLSVKHDTNKPFKFITAEDFEIYPLLPEILKRIKVDILYLPSYFDIFSFKTKKKIYLHNFSKKLCGKYRKGHFRGVLNVVNRFLEIIKPKYIVLGKKDFQQLFLIKNFVKKKFKIKVVSCSTVRDKNNLALSSRNILLNNKDIKKSSFIANLLIKFKKRIQKNISNKKELNNIINKINNIKKIKVEYLEIRNKNNLSKNYKKNNFKIFLAYYNKKVRLIDNY